MKANLLMQLCLVGALHAGAAQALPVSTSFSCTVKVGNQSSEIPLFPALTFNSEDFLGMYRITQGGDGQYTIVPSSAASTAALYNLGISEDVMKNAFFGITVVVKRMVDGSKPRVVFRVETRGTGSEPNILFTNDPKSSAAEILVDQAEAIVVQVPKINADLSLSQVTAELRCVSKNP